MMKKRHDDPPPIPDRQRFARTPPALYLDPRLTPNARLTYEALALHAYRDSASVSRETLAEITGLPPTRVSLQITQLANAGWAERVKDGRRGSPATYRLNPETRSELTPPGLEKRFAKTPERFIRDRRLTPNDRAVAAALRLYGFNGSCYPKLATLAAATGINKINVSKHTAALVALGWLVKTGNGGRGRPATYIFREPPPPITVTDSAKVLVTDSAKVSPITVTDSAKRKEEVLEPKIKQERSTTMNPNRICEPTPAPPAFKIPDDWRKAARSMAASLGLASFGEQLIEDQIKYLTRRNPHPTLDDLLDTITKKRDLMMRDDDKRERIETALRENQNAEAKRRRDAEDYEQRMRDRAQREADEAAAAAAAAERAAAGRICANCMHRQPLDAHQHYCAAGHGRRTIIYYPTPNCAPVMLPPDADARFLSSVRANENRDCPSHQAHIETRTEGDEHAV